MVNRGVKINRRREEILSDMKCLKFLNISIAFINNFIEIDGRR